MANGSRTTIIRYRHRLYCKVEVQWAEIERLTSWSRRVQSPLSSLFSSANFHAVRHAVNKFMLVILLNGLPTKLRFICQQDKLCLSESNNVLSESDILTFSTVFTLRCDLAYFIVLWSLELNWYWILFPLHLNNVGSSWRSLLISLNCSSAASSATN